MALQWLFESPESLQAAITLSIWLHSFHHSVFCIGHWLILIGLKVDIFSLDSDRAWCRWSCVLPQLHELLRSCGSCGLVEWQPRHPCATGGWEFAFLFGGVDGVGSDIVPTKNHLDLGVLRSHRTLITWGLCHLCVRRNWLEADSFFHFFPYKHVLASSTVLLYFAWLRQIDVANSHSRNTSI